MATEIRMQILDLNRSMIICANLSDIHKVLRVLIELEILNCHSRVKNRFLHPSEGGWRDLMLNFILPRSGHVCELQIVHNRMLTARKGLPGHMVYGRMRNASELMKAGQRSRRGKLKFLFEACNGENWEARFRQGWLEDENDLGSWAGIRVNEDQELYGIKLAQNQNLRGAIPVDFFASDCDRLIELDLSGCSGLVGPLPQSIVQCRSLGEPSFSPP